MGGGGLRLWIISAIWLYWQPLQRPGIFDRLCVSDIYVRVDYGLNYNCTIVTYFISGLLLVERK